jgi:hypothetical protein
MMRLSTAVLALMTVAALFSNLSSPASAAEPNGSRRGDVPSRGAASISLRSAPPLGSAAARFDVTVTPRTGRATKGRADVVGFPLALDGNWGEVEWNVSDSSMTGTLKMEDGTEVGRFEGTVTKTGVSGKFTHRDGRVGLWSWEGPAPGPVISDQMTE